MSLSSNQIPKYIYCKPLNHYPYLMCDIGQTTTEKIEEKFHEIEDDGELNDWITLALLVLIICTFLIRESYIWCQSISCTRVERDDDEPIRTRRRRRFDPRFDIETCMPTAPPRRSKRPIERTENCYYVADELKEENWQCSSLVIK